MSHMDFVNTDRVPDPAELLEVALRVARPAAELARSMRGEGVDQVATKSTDTDIVTAADQAVERQVRAKLAALRPGDVVLGEEFGAEESSGSESRGEPGGSTVRWIV